MMSRSVLATFVVSSFALVLGGAYCQAEAAGVQFNRARTGTLVNKDVGDERWAITYQFSDGTTTGNVTIAGQDDPVFIDCTQQSVVDGEGKFVCYSADACSEEPCAPSEWEFLSEVSLPVSFFFPPGVIPTGCTSWTPRLQRNPNDGGTCNLRLYIDNSECAEAQDDFQLVLLNCNGEQIDLTSRFSKASVAARGTTLYPLGDLPECQGKTAVSEVDISGTLKKTNDVSCLSACDPVGASCDRSADCCSDSCEGTEDGSFCVSNNTCLSTGAECEKSSDCCSSKCEGLEDKNVCVATSTCSGLGQSCGSGVGECCLGTECEGVDDGAFCVATDCRRVGESCGEDLADCCTGSCEGTEDGNSCVRTD